MESNQLEELKKDLEYDIRRLKYESARFKKRVCILLNLFIPGTGFFLFGKSHIKGLLSFILFISYSFFFYHSFFSEGLDTITVGSIFMLFVFYSPAIFVSVISTVFVAFLKE